MTPSTSKTAVVVSSCPHPATRKNPHPLRVALSRFTSAAAICAALSMAAAGKAQAIDFHWDPLADGDGALGGAGTWDAVSLFWDPTGLDAAVGAPDNVPWDNAPTSVAVFSGPSGVVSIATAVSANGLRFTSDGYSIQGGILDLAGADPTILVANPFDTATIDSLITGSGFTKSGDGQLTLAGSGNTFTGPLQVFGGRINFTADAQLGDPTNTIALNGGRIDYNNAAVDWDPSGVRIIAIGAAGGAIGGSRAIRITDNGQIIGSGTLTREGTGTGFALDIASANVEFTGNVVVNSGTIEYKNSQGLGTGEGQSITVNPGGMFSVAGLANRAATVAHSVTLAGGTLAFNNLNGGAYLGPVNVTASSGIALRDFYQTVNRSGQITGLLSGSGDLNVTATNTGTPNFASLLLSNPANTYSGAITINPNSQVRAIQGAATGALGTAAVQLNGGVLGISPVVAAPGANAGYFGRYYNSAKFGNGVAGGFDWGAEPVALSRSDLTVDFPATIPTGPGVNGTNMGVLWTGILNITTAGSYEFSTRSDDGSMLYIDGQLVVANDFAQAPVERFGSINLAAGAHSIIMKFGQGTGGAAMTGNYNGPDTDNTKVVLGSVANTLTNNGPSLFAPATIDNDIFVNGVGGVTNEIDLAGLNVTSTGTMVFASGAALRVTGSTGFETFTQAGDVVLSGQNRLFTGITLIGNLANNHPHQSASADVVISGTISGNSGFIKDGPRTLTLTGANTFTGTIDAQGGTLLGNSAVFNGNPITGTSTGTVVFHEPDDAAYFGPLDGSVAYRKTGAGMFTIAGPSAATGTFTVAQGSLRGVGFGGTVVMNPGTALALQSGSTFVAGGLTLNSARAQVTLGAPTLTPLLSTDLLTSASSIVNIESAPGFAAGTYRLFDYTGAPLTPVQFGQLTVGSTPGGSFFFTLANNTVDTAVDLAVEAFGALNTWTGGVSGTWDTATAGNWTDGAFAAGQRVTFADGPAIRDLTGGTVEPQQVNITAAADYTIANDISGTVAGGIQKSGTGTATFTGSVSVGGATNVTGGTLRLTNTSLATPNQITGPVSIGAGAVVDAAFGGPRAGTPGPSGTSALSGAFVSLDGGTLILRGGIYDGGSGGLTGQYYTQQVQRNSMIEFQTLGGITALFNTSTPETTTGGFTDTIGTVDYPNAFGANAPFNAAGGPGAPNPGVNFADNIMATWRGKFVAPLAGTNNYTFLGRSDDGLMVFVDGQLVLSSNFFQGNTLRNGSISLAQGDHDIFVAFYEGGGGAGVQVFENADGDPLDLADLRAAQPFTNLGNSVAWNASSTVAADNTYGVGFGSLLANTPNSTLTVGRVAIAGQPSGDGLVRFANTTFTASGTYTVEAQSDVALGVLADGENTVNLVKTGPSNLIMDGAALADANTTSISVESGRLVASNTIAGINPLGTASLVLNGVNTILQFNRSEFVAGNATFNNAITANQNARIETMRHGGGGGDILVGGSASPITVAPGRTLTLAATSGANMLLDGSISGAGANVLITSAGDPGSGQAFVLMRAPNTFTGSVTIESGTNLRIDNADALKTQRYVNVAANGRLEFFAQNTYGSNSPRIFSRPGSLFRLNPNVNPSTMFSDGTFDLPTGRILEFQSGNGYVGTGTFRHAPGSIFSLSGGNLLIFPATTTFNGLRGSDMRPFDLIRVTNGMTGANDNVFNAGWGSTTPGTIIQIMNGDRNLSVTNVSELNGQLITNDAASRTIQDGIRLDVGPLGGTIAATTGLALTVAENLQMDGSSGRLTIGANIPLDSRIANGTVVFAHPSSGVFTGTIENSDKAVHVINAATLEGRVSLTGASGLGTDASVAMGVALDRGTLRAAQPATAVNGGFVTVGKVFATGAGTLQVNRSAGGVVTEMRLATPIQRDAGATITLHAQNNSLGEEERIRFTDHFDAPPRLTPLNMVAPHFVSLANNLGTFVDYDPDQDFLTGPGFTHATYTAVTSAAQLGATGASTIADITSNFAMTENRSLGAARIRGNLSGNFTLTSESGGFIITSDSNPAANITVAANLAVPTLTELVVFSGGVNGGIHSINGTVTSDQGLTKFGPRTLHLGADNSTSLFGDITVNDASLTFTNNNALGAADNRIVLNGGNIRPQASMTFGRDIVVNAGGGAFNNDGNRDIRLTGLISGEGALTVSTTNGNNGITRMQQTSANTFTGGLVITNGTVEFSRMNQLGAPVSPTDYDSGQIVLNEVGATNASLRLATGSGTVATAGNQFTVLGNPRFDVAGASDTLVIDSEIRGSGGFTKGGAGTLVLSNSVGNGYTGTTTVAVGTLVVNSPIFSATGSGAVNVSGGATLAGTGTIDGSLTGTAGSIISPGVSLAPGAAGILRTQGGLTFQADAIYKWSLAALSTQNPGTDYDRLVVENGALTITGGADFKLDFGPGIAPSADAFWSANRLWEDIIQVELPGTIASAGFFDIDDTAYQAFGSFSLVDDGNGYDLVWTAVPEPGSAILLLGGLALTACGRRRRR